LGVVMTFAVVTEIVTVEVLLSVGLFSDSRCGYSLFSHPYSVLEKERRVKGLSVLGNVSLRAVCHSGCD